MKDEKSEALSEYRTGVSNLLPLKEPFGHAENNTLGATEPFFYRLK